jgi:hypothetical protein
MTIPYLTDVDGYEWTWSDVWILVTTVSYLIFGWQAIVYLSIIGLVSILLVGLCFGCLSCWVR